LKIENGKWKIMEAGADVSEADRAGRWGAKRGGKEVRCRMLRDDTDSKADAFLCRQTFSAVSYRPPLSFDACIC